MDQMRLLDTHLGGAPSGHAGARSEELRIDAGIVVCDKRGRILLCNQAAEQMFGGSGFAIEGMLLKRLIPDMPLDDIAESADAPPARSSGKRCKAIHCDGRRFPVEVRGKKFKLDGFALLLLNLRQLEDE